jgi:RNA polymerase sigma-70 factor, ECF subfamily
LPRVPTLRDAEPELLERIAAGDGSAMNMLFARYSIGVYRFALRFLGDESLAEDLVSEVFDTVWRNAGRFQGRSRESTWIFGIARIKVLSTLHRRKDDVFDEASAAAVADTADDPEISLQKKDRVAMLRECISHLSRKHREVIELIYYHEKSIAEVAEIVGVSKNTAKTRTFYARKRMSELLIGAGVDRL